uniref:Uncharacterized protein n=1 Tax=Mesocestoides corti TaxID=53468 RepID=A0A5K3FMB6_MESCO
MMSAASELEEIWISQIVFHGMNTWKRREGHRPLGNASSRYVFCPYHPQSCSVLLYYEVVNVV